MKPPKQPTVQDQMKCLNCAKRITLKGRNVYCSKECSQIILKGTAEPLQSAGKVIELNKRHGEREP